MPTYAQASRRQTAVGISRRRVVSTRNPASHAIADLHHAIGNRAVLRLADSGVLQLAPKDTVTDLERAKKDTCVGQPVDAAKASCEFSAKQSQFVRIIRDHALRRCWRAIAAINMPGNDAQVIRAAKDYLGLSIKFSDQTKRALVKKVKGATDKLEQAPIACGTCQDKWCNGGAAIAHVDEAKTHIIVCPQIFNDEINKVYDMPRTLIHEAAHLAGLDQDSTVPVEMYCFEGRTKEEKCPVIDPIHNVDAWSYFIEELSFTI
jgi:hypothetical protein